MFRIDIVIVCMAHLALNIAALFDKKYVFFILLVFVKMCYNENNGSLKSIVGKHYDGAFDQNSIVNFYFGQ